MSYKFFLIRLSLAVFTIPFRSFSRYCTYFEAIGAVRYSWAAFEAWLAFVWRKADVILDEDMSECEKELHAGQLFSKAHATTWKKLYLGKNICKWIIDSSILFPMVNKIKELVIWPIVLFNINQ